MNVAYTLDTTVQRALVFRCHPRLGSKGPSPPGMIYRVDEASITRYMESKFTGVDAIRAHLRTSLSGSSSHSGPLGGIRGLGLRGG
jgi:hypothetical protein